MTTSPVVRATTQDDSLCNDVPAHAHRWWAARHAKLSKIATRQRATGQAPENLRLLPRRLWLVRLTIWCHCDVTQKWLNDHLLNGRRIRENVITASYMCHGRSRILGSFYFHVANSKKTTSHDCNDEVELEKTISARSVYGIHVCCCTNLFLIKMILTKW